MCTRTASWLSPWFLPSFCPRRWGRGDGSRGERSTPRRRRRPSSPPFSLSRLPPLPSPAPPNGNHIGPIPLVVCTIVLSRRAGNHEIKVDPARSRIPSLPPPPRSYNYKRGTQRCTFGCAGGRKHTHTDTTARFFLPPPAAPAPPQRDGGTGVCPSVLPPPFFLRLPFPVLLRVPFGHPSCMPRILSLPPSSFSCGWCACGVLDCLYVAHAAVSFFPIFEAWLAFCFLALKTLD